MSATQSLVFVPVTGLEDTVVFPTNPPSETLTRQYLQEMSNQVRDYTNGDLFKFILMWGD